MEIRRFGPGHRRPDGPPGTRGVTGQVIHDGGGALVSELAFGRYAMVSPHSNPNTALFVVISGGGFVQVGEERARVNHGEAVVWPAGLAHGAFTDGTEMRAIIVELTGSGTDQALVLEGRAATRGQANGSSDGPADTHLDTEDRATDAATPRVTRADGTLAERHRLRDEYDANEGEPW